MNHTTFFAAPENVQRLRDAAGLVTSSPVDLGKSKELTALVAKVLRIIADHGKDFDRACDLTIKLYGSTLVSDLDAARVSCTPFNFETLATKLYVFLVEYDLSTSTELNLDLRQFIATVQSSAGEFSSDNQRSLSYAVQKMPIAVLKQMLRSDEFGTLKHVGEISEKAQEKIGYWDRTLGEAEIRAKRLSELLETQKDAFNFVGLHKGFADLETELLHERRIARAGLVIFGFLLLLPGLGELWIANSTSSALSSSTLTWSASISLIATVTLTLVFLYFFRIVLRKADSCRSQLVQVRLRMTLCRFIQNYVEYSAEINKNNPGALAKFESIIFSGIVASDDKLPSSFDGIEQLSGLVKSVRGGS